MYGYAGASVSATQLAPFSQPPQTTNPAGQTAQTAAVAQAAATGAGHAQAAASSSSLLSQLSTALQSLVSPASASSASASSGIVPVIAGEPITTYGIFGFSSALSTNDEAFRLIALATRLLGFQTSAVRDFAQGIGPFDPFFGVPLPSTAASVSAASAVMGRASQVSALSVPPSWTAISEPVQTAAVTLPTGADAQDVAGLPGPTLFGETLLGTLAGRMVSAAAAKSRENKDKTNNKVIPRSPAAG